MENIIHSNGMRLPYCLQKLICTGNMLKNKYHGIKKDWRLWKFFEERRDRPREGSNHREDLCCCRMVGQKNQVYKKFINRRISPDLDDLWDLLYGDNTATGEHYVAPSMNTSPATELQSSKDQAYDFDIENMDSG
ncbi:LOW QUALITY PROTEIN: hypothetical protein V2J09_013237 [Rumex salicifolius]